MRRWKRPKHPSQFSTSSTTVNSVAVPTYIPGCVSGIQYQPVAVLLIPDCGLWMMY
jgi:hypothetical protein